MWEGPRGEKYGPGRYKSGPKLSRPLVESCKLHCLQFSQQEQIIRENVNRVYLVIHGIATTNCKNHIHIYKFQRPSREKN